MKSCLYTVDLIVPLSLPTRGEWIEIATNISVIRDPFCLSPHGESGLKYNYICSYVTDSGLSPHGESGLKCLRWVYIHLVCRLSPHGESGLKLSPAALIIQSASCLSPHGESGLKYKAPSRKKIAPTVSPHTGRVD